MCSHQTRKVSRAVMGSSCDKVKLYKDQDYCKLVKQFRKKKQLFEDPEFLTSNALLPNASFSEGFSYQGTSWNRREIIWLRPHQICDHLNESLGQEKALKPQFFVGNQDR